MPRIYLTLFKDGYVMPDGFTGTFNRSTSRVRGDAEAVLRLAMIEAAFADMGYECSFTAEEPGGGADGYEDMDARVKNRRLR